MAGPNFSEEHESANVASVPCGQDAVPSLGHDLAVAHDYCPD